MKTISPLLKTTTLPNHQKPLTAQRMQRICTTLNEGQQLSPNRCQAVRLAVVGIVPQGTITAVISYPVCVCG